MTSRVLVADTSATMRKIHLRVLKSLGFNEIVEAEDGEQALQAFSPGKFRMVLTDWEMPGKTGLELLQAIRAVDPEVTVIMITTAAERGRVLEAIEAGVSDYLVKPFESDALLQKLQQYAALTA